MSADQSFRWSTLLTPSRRRQLWYFPLLVTAMALMMARSLVMAHLLGVQSFAQFSGGILVSSSFCMLGCLGLQIVLQREWPVDILRGQELRGLMRAAQCNLAAVACAFLVIAAALWGVSVGTVSPTVLIMGVLHGCSQQIFIIATVESRSRGDALRFSKENLARALGILTVGCVAAVWSNSGVGVLASEALLTFALAVALWHRSARHGRLAVLHLYALALRQLPRAPWRAAAILTAIMAVTFLVVSLDRWTAAARLSAAEFAAYSFAWTVPSLAQSAQQVLNTSIYPMMVRRFAGAGPRSAFRLCVASSLLVLGAGAVAALPAFFVLERCVHAWFPRYAGVVVIVPMLLAVAVLRVSDFWSSFLLVAGREGVLLLANSAVLLAGALVWALWNYLPGSTLLTPADAARLALILSTLSYATAMGCAWGVRMRQSRAEAPS